MDVRNSVDLDWDSIMAVHEYDAQRELVFVAWSGLAEYVAKTKL